MSLTKRSRTRRRAGLTLIELIVVLVILVALGGIAVGIMPDMLNRTHVATVATSLPAVDSAIRQHVMLNSGTIGDGFDSLLTSANAVATFVQTDNTAYEAYTLTADDLAALEGIGITALVVADDTVENATFDGHAAAPAALAVGSRVCTLSSTAAANILPSVWNYTPPVGSEFVVVGLGARCSLVGGGANAAFSEAPVHFVDSHSERANTSYARVMIVIELANAGTADAEARFIGTGAPHPDGIQGVATHLKEFYSN